MRARTPSRWFTIAAPAAVFLLLASLTVHARASAPVQDPPSAADVLATLRDEGMVIYGRECASCHGAEGQGDGAGPTLAGNTALANKEHVIKRILGGTLDAAGMDPFGAVLNDRQVAAAATYVRNAWENANGVVLEADVKPIREQLKKDQDAKKK